MNGEAISSSLYKWGSGRNIFGKKIKDLKNGDGEEYQIEGNIHYKYPLRLPRNVDCACSNL